MLGPPGAGKGTQAERLSRTRKVPKISTGEFSVKPCSRARRGPHGEGDDGSREPGGDDIMIAIVHGRLNRPDAHCGFVLDGFPRTVVQATALDRMMADRGPLVVLNMVVPEDVLVRRLATRRICRKCGANAAPEWTKACGKCGGTLITRVDDGIDIVRERLKVYQRQTQPLVEYYSKRPTFTRLTAIVRRRRGSRGRCGAGRRNRSGRARSGAVIVCKSPAELEKMRAANALVADVLAELAGMVAPGITTNDLDVAAERLVRAGGAEPAFKGYRGYPCTLCASVNEQVVHGIPSKRSLGEGDIISLDMGVKLNGFYGDSAVTVPVGKVSDEAAMLLRVTRETSRKGSRRCGSVLGSSDIGHAIQQHVEEHGFSVVRELSGMDRRCASRGTADCEYGERGGATAR